MSQSSDSFQTISKTPSTTLVVLVTSESSKSVRIAKESITTACQKPGLKLELVAFEKLDFGETVVVDKFYAADVVVVDMTTLVQQSSLFYHLGVRESFGKEKNVVMFSEIVDPDVSQSLSVRTLLLHYSIGNCKPTIDPCHSPFLVYTSNIHLTYFSLSSIYCLSPFLSCALEYQSLLHHILQQQVSCIQYSFKIVCIIFFMTAILQFFWLCVHALHD